MPKLTSILLVDDDSTTSFLNQSLIKRTGIAQHLRTAENGAEALQALHQTYVLPSTSCPNLILLDMKMPIMNGIEFLEFYAQLPSAQRKSIIIVMLTTFLLAQDLKRVRRLSISGILSKSSPKKSFRHW